VADPEKELCDTADQREEADQPPSMGHGLADLPDRDGGAGSDHAKPAPAAATGSARRAAGIGLVIPSVLMPLCGGSRRR
jgi:hypothetical protein